MFRRHYILLLLLLVGGGAFGEANPGAGSDHDPKLSGYNGPGTRGPAAYINFNHPRASIRTLDVTNTELEEFEELKKTIPELPLSLFVMAKTANTDVSFLPDAFRLIQAMRGKTIDSNSAEGKALVDLLMKNGVLKHYIEPQGPDRILKPNLNRLFEDLALLGEPFEAKTGQAAKEKAARDALEPLLQEPFRLVVAAASNPDSAPSRRESPIPPTGERGELGAPSRNGNGLDPNGGQVVQPVNPITALPLPTFVATQPPEDPDKDKDKNKKNLAQNQPPEENDRPPGTPGNPKSGGGSP